MKDALRELKHKILNFFKWGWRLRNVVNWDSSQIHDMIEYQLKDVLREALVDPHYMWTEPHTREMKSLKEAVGLLKLLKDNNFMCKSAHTEAVYRKWGSPEMDLGDSDGSGLSRCFITHKNVKTEADEKAFRLEFRAATKKDSAIYNDRRKRLYYLLLTFDNSWSM